MTVPKVLYKGEIVDGDDVSFSVVKDDWNTYQLHDGTEIRVRLIVQEVIKIPGEVDGQGNPVYVVKSNNVLVIKPAETA